MTRCFHDWPVSGIWGVILGVTRCRKCGKLATAADFPKAEGR